jgi:hypothetical protein
MDLDSYRSIDWERAKLFAEKAVQFSAHFVKSICKKKADIDGITYSHLDYKYFELDCLRRTGDNNIVLAFSNSDSDYGISYSFDYIEHGKSFNFYSDISWKWPKFMSPDKDPQYCVYLMLPIASRLVLANNQNIKYKC